MSEIRIPKKNLAPTAAAAASAAAHAAGDSRGRHRDDARSLAPVPSGRGAYGGSRAADSLRHLASGANRPRDSRRPFDSADTLRFRGSRRDATADGLGETSWPGANLVHDHRRYRSRSRSRDLNAHRPADARGSLSGNRGAYDAATGRWGGDVRATPHTAADWARTDSYRTWSRPHEDPAPLARRRGREWSPPTTVTAGGAPVRHPSSPRREALSTDGRNRPKDLLGESRDFMRRSQEQDLKFRTTRANSRAATTASEGSSGPGGPPAVREAADSKSAGPGPAAAGPDRGRKALSPVGGAPLSDVSALTSLDSREVQSPRVCGGGEAREPAPSACAIAATDDYNEHVDMEVDQANDGLDQISEEFAPINEGKMGEAASQVPPAAFQASETKEHSAEFCALRPSEPRRSREVSDDDRQFDAARVVEDDREALTPVDDVARTVAPAKTIGINRYGRRPRSSSPNFVPKTISSLAEADDSVIIGAAVASPLTPVDPEPGRPPAEEKPASIVPSPPETPLGTLESPPASGCPSPANRTNLPPRAVASLPRRTASPPLVPVEGRPTEKCEKRPRDETLAPSASPTAITSAAACQLVENAISLLNLDREKHSKIELENVADVSTGTTAGSSCPSSRRAFSASGKSPPGISFAEPLRNAVLSEAIPRGPRNLAADNGGSAAAGPETTNIAAAEPENMHEVRGGARTSVGEKREIEEPRVPKRRPRGLPGSPPPPPPVAAPSSSVSSASSVAAGGRRSRTRAVGAKENPVPSVPAREFTRTTRSRTRKTRASAPRAAAASPDAQSARKARRAQPSGGRRTKNAAAAPHPQSPESPPARGMAAAEVLNSAAEDSARQKTLPAAEQASVDSVFSQKPVGNATADMKLPSSPEVTPAVTKAAAAAAEVAAAAAAVATVSVPRRSSRKRSSASDPADQKVIFLEVPVHSVRTLPRAIHRSTGRSPDRWMTRSSSRAARDGVKTAELDSGSASVPSSGGECMCDPSTDGSGGASLPTVSEAVKKELAEKVAVVKIKKKPPTWEESARISSATRSAGDSAREAKRKKLQTEAGGSSVDKKTEPASAPAAAAAVAAATAVGADIVAAPIPSCNDEPTEEIRPAKPSLLVEPPPAATANEACLLREDESASSSPATPAVQHPTSPQPSAPPAAPQLTPWERLKFEFAGESRDVRWSRGEEKKQLVPCLMQRLLERFGINRSGDCGCGRKQGTLRTVSSVQRVTLALPAAVGSAKRVGGRGSPSAPRLPPLAGEAGDAPGQLFSDWPLRRRLPPSRNAALRRDVSLLQRLLIKETKLRLRKAGYKPWRGDPAAWHREWRAVCRGVVVPDDAALVGGGGGVVRYVDIFASSISIIDADGDAGAAARWAYHEPQLAGTGLLDVLAKAGIRGATALMAAAHDGYAYAPVVRRRARHLQASQFFLRSKMLVRSAASEAHAVRYLYRPAESCRPAERCSSVHTCSTVQELLNFVGASCGAPATSGGTEGGDSQMWGRGLCRRALDVRPQQFDWVSPTGGDYPTKQGGGLTARSARRALVMRFVSRVASQCAAKRSKRGTDSAGESHISRATDCGQERRLRDAFDLALRLGEGVKAAVTASAGAPETTAPPAAVPNPHDAESSGCEDVDTLFEEGGPESMGPDFPHSPTDFGIFGQGAEAGWNPEGPANDLFRTPGLWAA